MKQQIPKSTLSNCGSPHRRSSLPSLDLWMMFPKNWRKLSLLLVRSFLITLMLILFEGICLSLFMMRLNRNILVKRFLLSPPPRFPFTQIVPYSNFGHRFYQQTVQSHGRILFLAVHLSESSGPSCLWPSREYGTPLIIVCLLL